MPGPRNYCQCNTNCYTNNQCKCVKHGIKCTNLCKCFKDGKQCVDPRTGGAAATAPAPTVSNTTGGPASTAPAPTVSNTTGGPVKTGAIRKKDLAKRLQESEESRSACEKKIEELEILNITLTNELQTLKVEMDTIRKNEKDLEKRLAESEESRSACEKEVQELKIFNTTLVKDNNDLIKLNMR